MVTATLRNKNGTLDTTFSKNGFYRSQFFLENKKREEQRGTRGPGNDEGSVIWRRNGGGCHRYSNRSRLATFHHRFISVFFSLFLSPVCRVVPQIMQPPSFLRAYCSKREMIPLLCSNDRSLKGSLSGSRTIPIFHPLFIMLS